MSVAASRTWYVVQTHVNAEAKAAHNLLRQGFEVYLPRYLKRRSHARKVERVPSPLFPRYLFVSIDLATGRWRPIQSTLGVSHLVTSGSDPALVPEGVVSALKCREDDSGYVRLHSRPKFAPGEKVRVLSGVFADELALFDGMADCDRVAILLDLLGRRVRVSVAAELIVAA